jgi:hypothetical protein
MGSEYRCAAEPVSSLHPRSCFTVLVSVIFVRSICTRPKGYEGLFELFSLVDDYTQYFAGVYLMAVPRVILVHHAYAIVLLEWLRMTYVVCLMFGSFRGRIAFACIDSAVLQSIFFSCSNLGSRICSDGHDVLCERRSTARLSSCQQ